MHLIAIDGACHHNGKVDSIGCGACAVIHNNEENSFMAKDLHTGYLLEENSTNQRAELHGLLLALSFIVENPANYLVVTDSEYIFNAMTRGWIHNWMCNDWLTSAREPVKNQDLWKDIYVKLCAAERLCEDTPCFYHIKGHVVSFGKVTRNCLLSYDPTGFKLIKELIKNFDNKFNATDERIEKAQVCSERNNGFKLEYNQLRRFVAMNMLADALASYKIDEYLQGLQEHCTCNKSDCCGKHDHIEYVCYDTKPSS